MWSEQEGWEGKRSRGLGDDGGGGRKSSKRVEVARALKRNVFAVLCTALSCKSVKLSLFCCFLSYCQLGRRILVLFVVCDILRLLRISNVL